MLTNCALLLLIVNWASSQRNTCSISHIHFVWVDLFIRNKTVVHDIRNVFQLEKPNKTGNLGQRKYLFLKDELMNYS